MSSIQPRASSTQLITSPAACMARLGAGDPYVTGAVVHGSHAGAMGGYAGAGGGQAAATGAGRHQLPQQQQPALLSTSTANANRIDILFMICVSLPETSVELTTAIAGPMFDASDAQHRMARVATQPYLAPHDVQMQRLKNGNIAGLRSAVVTDLTRVPPLSPAPHPVRGRGEGLRIAHCFCKRATQPPAGARCSSSVSPDWTDRSSTAICSALSAASAPSFQ